MSLPNRNNPYNFDAFREVRDNYDYYADDAYLQKVLAHYAGEDFETVDQTARGISAKASTSWRKTAEKIARPEEELYILHYDAYHRRIDRIVRSAAAEQMEKEVYGEKIFAEGKSPWERVVSMFLIYQNGEAAVGCSLTCTEGLVEAIKRYADTEELQQILQHVQEGIDGEIGIGAQFVSEIQSGSDVPNNLLEAVEEDGQWRLYGSKFWTSAIHADYSMVTAKPKGSEKVGLFVVPMWLAGDKEKEMRNGHTVDRLKWKLGTKELPSGEITYDGAVAYPVGPLERGLQNVVGIVLTLSRLTIGLNSATSIRRAVREARQYAEFRETFGTPISQYGLVASQLKEMEYQSERALAAAFKMYHKYFSLPDGLSMGMPKDGTLAERKEIFQTRVLIMWQKSVASLDSTDIIRKSMSLFGGFGAIEDFSSLPRLYRDSAINELWEGPVNLLMDQIYRDFQRAIAWYPVADFVAETLKGLPESKIAAFVSEMEELLAHESLVGTDDKTLDIASRWYAFVFDFFHAYQDVAHQEIG